MYRCRRLAAVITAVCLSLACITSFSFYASADIPNPTVQLYWKKGESSSALDTGNWYSPENTYVHTVPYKVWSMEKFRVYHFNNPCDIWITFNLNFLSTIDDDSRSLAQIAGSISGVKSGTWDLGSGSFALLYDPSFPSEIDMLPDMYPLQGGRRVLIHFIYDGTGNQNWSEFTFSSRAAFGSSGSNKPSLVPVCTDFEIYHDIQSLINAGFDGVNTQLLNLVDIASSLYSVSSNYFDYATNYMGGIASALFDIYSWTQLSYDPDTGNIVQNASTGNYFAALLGSIQSLNADAQAQAAEQEKANEVGAGDALDTAFDSVGSSFGSLGDLSGLGELGGFNGDAMGNAGSAGLLDWFSQRTADSIDAVPQKKEPLDIIDFYSGKISAYEEVMDDGTTDP